MNLNLVLLFAIGWVAPVIGRISSTIASENGDILAMDPTSLLTHTSEHTHQNIPQRVMSCTAQSNCLITQVCISGACVDSAAPEMLDNIAKFSTDNNAATFDSTTSSTFGGLFQCSLDDDLLKQQHFLWKGFVDYFVEYDNNIFVHDGNGGSDQIVDQWGDRCEVQPTCDIPVERYSECPDAATCAPKDLEYPLDSSSATINIEIYEPCNFVSNLAYYRVMPQLCGSNLFMNAQMSNALVHAMGALAAGSSIWHGSHTYLGYQIDNQLIGVVAFLIHQLIVKDGLGDANGLSTDQDTDLRVLADLSPSSRTKTAIEVSQGVTDSIIEKHVSEWTSVFKNLDVPEYFETFTIIIASTLTIIFPDRPETMSSLLGTLASTFGADPAALDIYLPKIQEMSVDLNLPDTTKFVLFRQLFGTFGKFIFAFLWQEQLLDIPLFLEPRTNEIAPNIMPPLISLFNFISGFDYDQNDAKFQDFDGVYPGDEQCRATVPHSKWHEISAMGLLDLTYMADCVAAAANGNFNNGGCAHLQPGSFQGGAITKSQIESWVESTFKIPNIPIIKDIIPVFVADIFLFFDFDDDDQIEWSDIVHAVDNLEAVANTITSFIAKIEEFIDMFDNFCYQDSQCDATTEFCNPLRFGCRPKRNGNFFPCIKDSQCYTDRCVDLTRICKAKLENGETCTADKACASGTCGAGLTPKCGKPCSLGCSSGEWCNGNYSPDICRPKRDNGWGPCIADRQCFSDRCVDTTRVCARKKSRGEGCFSGKECLSGRCRWFRCR